MALPSYATALGDFPQMYERLLVGPLFRHWAEALLDAADIASLQSALDIACGTGIVARLLRQRLEDRGRIVGVDMSDPLLAVAREVAPEIDWREGDAAALPIDEERFDAVLCHQGLQFFADKPRALDEMRRVSAPRARLAIAVWRPVGDAPLLQALHDTAERHLGPIHDQRYGFGDADALRNLVGGAGFEDVRVERVSLPVQFPDAAVFVRMNAAAMVAMSRAAEAQRAQLIEALTADGMGAARAHCDEEGLRFDMAANFALARAP